MLKIALKLLVNDRGKFAALIVGITFAIFLIVQLTSIFSGILAKASATVINIGARIWVMDPSLQNPLNTIPMPDYVLDLVKSMNGVKYAVDLYSGVGLVKLKDGTSSRRPFWDSTMPPSCRQTRPDRRQHRRYLRR